MAGIQDTFDEMSENWKKRIVQECEEMHEAVESLRTLAQAAIDERVAAKMNIPSEAVQMAKEENFLHKVESLHSLYCDIANTVTLRLLLNGALSTLGCGEEGKPK